MANYDVDGSSVDFAPARVEWLPPPYIENQDGSATQSIYWSVRLVFSGRGNMPPEAWAEWAAFNDFGQHTIVLPLDDEFDSGSFQLFSGVYIRTDNQPGYDSVNVDNFTMLVTNNEVTP